MEKKIGDLLICTSPFIFCMIGQPSNTPTESDLAAMWEEQIVSGLSNVLQAQPETLDVVTPFDAASDMDIEEQRLVYELI